MYCPYCQTVLADDAVFCRHCGKRVKAAPAQTDSADAGQQAQQHRDQKETLRNSELSTLNSLMQYFSQKQASYDLYDDTCAKVNRLARGSSNALLIWGGIVIGIFALVILSVISSAQNFQDISTSLFLSIFLLLAPGIMMIAGGILKKTNHRRMVYQHQQQYVELSRELHQHFQSCRNCPIVPECTNPRILVKLQSIIISGRADTLKEGMNNLFASSNHRGIAQYQEITERNTFDCNYRNGLKFIFLPPKYFR